MKLTEQQLKEMGYVEKAHGNWEKIERMVKRAQQGLPMIEPPPSKPLKRIRQSSKPLMNKLESEFLAYISTLYPSWKFRTQCLRFKLGNGIWYKPDVVCLNFNGSFACWEVKGPHAFRGGFENLKVAANQYPEIMWKLVWNENNRWQEQEVLP